MTSSSIRPKKVVNSDGDPGGVGRQHDVLTGRIQARTSTARHRPGLTEGSVRVGLVLALQADAAVGIPEHEDQRGHVHQIFDRGVAGAASWFPPIRTVFASWG